MQKIGIVLVSLLGVCLPAEWSYSDEAQWGGACRTGIQQSPINIVSQTAVVDKDEAHIRGPLVFRGYGDVKVSAENNGRTLQWNRDPRGPAPTVSGGPLRGNYTFQQFHLHWMSEHAIDGMKYPLEIHLVHTKFGLTLEEAILRPDGLAVIGILAQVTSDYESTFALEEIMPVVPELVEQHTIMINDYKNIDLRRLLSPFPQSYFTYQGSLTTPDCQEAVTWIVMDRPTSISDIQHKEISKVDVGGIDNYRSLQPIHRVVYRSVVSSPPVQVPSILRKFASRLPFNFEKYHA